jgi:4'-phosphopantetheinyl transferase
LNPSAEKTDSANIEIPGCHSIIFRQWGRGGGLHPLFQLAGRNAAPTLNPNLYDGGAPSLNRGDQMWRVPCGRLSLLTNEVHLWRVALNPSGESVADFEAILAPDEIKRADRFRFERGRRRYVVKQALLRIILSEFYLDCRPVEIRFGTNRHGKPHLKRPFNGNRFFFNTSDSDELALFAFARNAMIGIDVECLRAVSDAAKIAAQTFCRAENLALHCLPPHQKQAAFFNCWTRKEAFIKALGKGLSYPLNRFEVSIAPGEAARLISIEDDFKEADKWSLASMLPMHGYIGALAVKMKKLSIKYWKYPDWPQGH